MIELLIALSVVCSIIVLANLQQQASTDADFMTPLRLSWYALVILIMSIGITVLIYSPEIAANQGESVPDIDPVLRIGFAVFAFALAGIAFAVVRFRQMRVFIHDHIAHLGDSASDKSKSGISIFRPYDPDSPVHTTAIVLAIAHLVNTLSGFVLSGGVEGIAQNLELSQPGISDLLLMVVLYGGTALLGVGIFIRRDLSDTLQRLGLRTLQRDDVIWGLTTGIGLFVAQIGIGIVWSLFTEPETFAQQTQAAEAIFEAFRGSLFLGFMLALTASVGEEILFRGALQPVFGIIPTSIYFVLLHTQYTLTPASFIILFVAFGLGWVRNRYSTNAAILAHFIYNFLPFVLFQVAPESQAILLFG